MRSLCWPRTWLQAQPYYELTVPDSDEEFEPASADASGMTGVERDTASGAGPTLSTASDACTAQQEQQEEVEQRAVAQQEGEAEAAAVQQPEEQQQQAADEPTKAAAGGVTSSAATAGPPASAAAAAGGDAAAQETSSKSEETAVPETGAEELSLPLLRAGGKAARGAKDGTEHSGPRKRSRRRPGGLGDPPAVQPAADTAVEVAVL